MLRENPNLAFRDISTVSSRRWKKLTAEERQPYDDMRTEDAKRYEREMETYTAALRAEAVKGVVARARRERKGVSEPRSEEEPMAVNVSIIMDEESATYTLLSPP